MSDGREWKAFPHREECLICRHKGGWCTVSPDGDLIRCRRVQSDRPSPGKDGVMAWLHPVPDAERHRAASLSAAPRAKRQTLSQPEWQNLWKQHRTAVNPQKLRKFADRLGVSVESLEAYGVGFDRETGCYSWPMYDGRRRIVGIRIRSEDGKVKACVKNRANQNGLFIPLDYAVAPLSEDTNIPSRPPLLLLLPEGPTDAAAAWDLDLPAVGRPNGSSGVLFVQELLGATPFKQEVVVVGENDGPVWPHVPDARPLFPGVSGALACARDLMGHAAAVKLVMPPKGVKDFRDWKRFGCTAADVALAVGRAAAVTPDWLGRAERTLERRKAEAVDLFDRMCGRMAACALSDDVAKAERLRQWMQRRGYPVDVHRRAAA